MASSRPPDNAALDSPRKRQKLSSSSPLPSSSLAFSNNNPTATSQSAGATGTTVAKMDEMSHEVAISETGFQPGREKECAILYFVNEQNPGFTGILKQRYTDFIVNEIALDGTVVHLTTDKPSKAKAAAKDDNLRHSLSTQTLPRAAAASEAGSIDTRKPASTITADTKITSLAPSTYTEQDTDSKLEGPQPSPTSEEAGQANERPTFSLNPTDTETLVSYFGCSFKDDLVNFQQRIFAKPDAKPATLGSLLSHQITDRVLRGRIHQDIRRIFNSKIESLLVDGDLIKFTAAPPLKPHPEGYQRRPQRQNQPKGKLGWQELGGEYLHFSLYKENKNTLEVTSFMSRCLRVRPKEFGFAGTKDRRAATTQRVSIKRQHAETLAKINPSLKFAKIGDFKYEKHGLELGDLQGNEFTITLRDCQFGDDSSLDRAERLQHANDVVSQAVHQLKLRGFINYFGLQRFGSFETGTDEVGKKILQGDYEGAIEAILSFKQEPLSMEPTSWESRRGRDKVASDILCRAHAINAFKETGKYQSLPHVFSAEQSIIRHLSSSNKSTDYIGALMGITRNLRSMYVHAYQSLVWNTVASERWRRYGDKVIGGDLILIDKEAKKAETRQDDVDASGEVVIHPADDDTGISYEDIFQRARPLTAEEAGSGQYTVFDIVLPTPGFDIEYPSNSIGDFYKEFMGSQQGGGLDPANMRRAQKDFSLSGSYRKLIGQVGKDMSFEIRPYLLDGEQLVDTDLDRLNKSKKKNQTSSQNQSYSDKTQSGRDHGRNQGRNQGRRSDYNADPHRGGNEYSTQQNGHRQASNGGAQQLLPAYNASYRLPTPTQSIVVDSPPEIHPNLAAWQSLPAKLAAEAEAAANSHQLEESISNAINPDAVAQPIYKETFIETSLIDNEGRRTGHRSTKYIGADGKEVTKEEADAIYEANAKLASKAEANVEEKAEAKLDAKSETGVSINDKFPAAGSLVVAAGHISESPDTLPALVDHSTADTTSPSPRVNPMDDALNDQSQSYDPPPTKLAVIIKFTLASSMYATIALRELMKAGGVKTYRPDFSSGA